MGREMVQGEVEAMGPLLEAQDGVVYWWRVKLKGREDFAVHQNWVAAYGALNPGDRVQYIVSKARMGRFLLFDRLRRVEEEKPVEEEMVKLVREGP